MKNFDFIFNDITYQILTVIVITAFLHLIVKFVLVLLSRSTRFTNNQYDDLVISAITKPILWVTWIIGVIFTIDIIDIKIDEDVYLLLSDLLQISVIVLTSWAVVRVITAIELEVVSNLKGKNRFADDGTISAFAKLLRIIVIMSMALILLQYIGFSISGLLAFGGIGGIAIGFAAQDLLSNFFGGLMIHLDRPFAVGDWVRSPDQNIEGTVENIGWRVTTIRTFDKRPLYVPNSTFSTISVENPSRMSNRRIKETIGIRYDDARQVKLILDEVRNYLINHPDIDTKQTLMVNFNEFGESSLDFFIYCFTKTTVWTEYHMVKESVLLDILDIVHKHSADFAYPTQRLSVELMK